MLSVFNMKVDETNSDGESRVVLITQDEKLVKKAVSEFKKTTMYY